MRWSHSNINILIDRAKSVLPGAAAHDTMIGRGDGSGRARRTRPRPEDSVRVGAVLLLLVADENDTLHLPLIRRTDDGGPHGGQIALPGGRAEGDNESYVETALREAHEEIGVHPDGVEVIGELSPLWISVSGYEVHPVLATYPDGLAALRSQLVAQPGEVAEILIPGVGDLLDQVYTRTVVARGQTFEVPCFVADTTIVWGATAAILAELRALWHA